MTLGTAAPLETTTLTAELAAAFVPAAGLSLITSPEATVLLECCVTVPTVSPAPVIAVVAAACVWPTTFGTATGTVKVAVTNWSEFAMGLHELLPVQGPLQPENSDPGEAKALRLTAVPSAKLAAQDDVPQLMPDGLLVTVPWPLPDSITASACVVAMPPPSSTVRFEALTT
jgi:hypothetical protein